MIILKLEPKPDERGKNNDDDDERYGSLHDEQQSIQMTILHRNTHENTVQTSTVIINNGSKNSKCRPKSDTQ